VFDRTLLAAFGIYVAVFVGLDRVLDYRLTWVGALLLYPAIYAAVAGFAAIAGRKSAPAPPRSTLPVSGPIGRFGQGGLVAAFTLTSALSLLNPFQAVQLVRQAVANVRLGWRARRCDAAGYASRVAYSLPFAGEWFVYNGGTTTATSHSWALHTQRYAYDFVVVDGALRRHAGAGTALSDYYCYRRDIVAAAEGVVVRVEARIGAAPFVGWGIADFLARSFIGNHVLVRHAKGEYALYAHLVGDSVTLKPGDVVARGERMGLCGHSGHSSEPHLHFHLQDSPNLFLARGLPVCFTGVVVDGQLRASASLAARSRVRNAGPGETGAARTQAVA
jgi:murein DD-endopeptidase MepM/ murein hydrolase activator NlpD